MMVNNFVSPAETQKPGKPTIPTIEKPSSSDEDSRTKKPSSSEEDSSGTGVGHPFETYESP